MQFLTDHRRNVALAAMLVLGACASAELAGHIAAVSRPQGEGIYKVGQPYQIEGDWYYPQEDFTYDRTGMASWYGPGFDGQLTANGEIYDQNALTAAHPTLQMPSLARVTNLRNGRSVVVRINDRGPFARDRIIDVSKRAAQLLGFTDQGTAPVRVQVLTQESRAIAERARNGQPQEPIVLAAAPESAMSVPAHPAAPVMEALPREKVQVTALAEPPSVAPGAAARAPIAILPGRPASTVPALPVVAPAAAVQTASIADPAPRVAVQSASSEPAGIYVQAGAFSVLDNATRLQQGLSSIAAARISPTARGDGTTLYLVRLGPLVSTAEADRVLSSVIDRGHTDALIIVR